MSFVNKKQFKCALESLGVSLSEESNRYVSGIKSNKMKVHAENISENSFEEIRKAGARYFDRNLNNKKLLMTMISYK